MSATKARFTWTRIVSALMKTRIRRVSKRDTLLYSHVRVSYAKRVSNWLGRNSVIQSLTSEDKWKEIANGYQKLANCPNCIGALDGKHVRVIKPTKSGSLFYNYKHYFSIFLMAISDANYCFTFVDVGAQGKFCDSSVFKNCTFYQKLENNTK